MLEFLLLIFWGAPAARFFLFTHYKPLFLTQGRELLESIPLITSKKQLRNRFSKGKLNSNLFKNLAAYRRPDRWYYVIFRLTYLPTQTLKVILSNISLDLPTYPKILRNMWMTPN